MSDDGPNDLRNFPVLDAVAPSLGPGTATATDAAGNRSEFARNIVAPKQRPGMRRQAGARLPS